MKYINETVLEGEIHFLTTKKPKITEHVIVKKLKYLRGKTISNIHK